MKRARIEEYCSVPAPDEHLSDAPGRAHFESAVPAGNGFPALVRFSLGAAPPADVEDALTVSAHQLLTDQRVQLRAKDPARPAVRWVADLTPSPDYMIAVVDKTNGTARVFETAGACCFSRVVRAAPDKAAPVHTSEDLTYRERRENLLGEFGGKRAKDRQAKIERNAITDERVSNDAAAQLEGAIGEHQQRKAAESPRQGTTESLAPPHNSNATRVEDAYPLSGLMSSIEYTFLLKEARESLENADAETDPALIRNPGWHPVCWDLMLQALHIKADEEGDAASGEEVKERCRRVMASMYLHYLITLVNLSSKKLGWKERCDMREAMAVSDEVLELLLERFTERRDKSLQNERYQSDQTRSRLMYFAVVFWLTACGFSASLGVDEFAKALCAKVSTVMVHIVHVGGKVKRSRSDGDGPSPGYRANLTVPLVFPAVRRARHTQRKRR